MICKFCNAEFGDDSLFCPVCGKSLTEAEQPETPAEQPVFSSEFIGQPEELVKPRKKVWPVVLAAVGAVLALVVLAVVLLLALGVEIKLPQNDIHRKESYTAVDEEAVEKAGTVVAQIGDAKLTNSQLQIYYRMQVLDFVNYYSSYLSSIGFDHTQPLAEQKCYFDDTKTWEQYFIEVSITAWQNYQTLALQAEESDFTLGEDWEAEIAAIPESLESQATEGGYENADAMIKELLGPACSLDDYMEYVRLNALSNEYYASIYEQLTPTDDEVDAYYTENEEAFTGNGITRDGGLVSSVRHILVCPDGGTTDESGAVTYSDAEWAACLAEAERILQEWKDGEATEDSFAALVATYTEDPGSQSTGGLYENINPTSSYVENFLNWSVDMSRQPGDTGIVQTEYGYHIMYFVTGEAYWYNSAKTQLMSERNTDMLEEAKESFPMEVKYKNICLSELELAQ